MTRSPIELFWTAKNHSKKAWLLCPARRDISVCPRSIAPPHAWSDQYDHHDEDEDDHRDTRPSDGDDENQKSISGKCNNNISGREKFDKL